MERAAFQCLQIFAAPVMKFCLSLCFAYKNFAVTLIQNVFGPKRTLNCSTPCLLSLNDKFDNNAQTFRHFEFFNFEYDWFVIEI